MSWHPRPLAGKTLGTVVSTRRCWSPRHRRDAWGRSWERVRGARPGGQDSQSAHRGRQAPRGRGTTGGRDRPCWYGEQCWWKHQHCPYHHQQPTATTAGGRPCLQRLSNQRAVPSSTRGEPAPQAPGWKDPGHRREHPSMSVTPTSKGRLGQKLVTSDRRGGGDDRAQNQRRISAPGRQTSLRANRGIWRRNFFGPFYYTKGKSGRKVACLIPPQGGI